MTKLEVGKYLTISDGKIHPQGLSVVSARQSSRVLFQSEKYGLAEQFTTLGIVLSRIKNRKDTHVLINPLGDIAGAIDKEKRRNTKRKNSIIFRKK